MKTEDELRSKPFHILISVLVLLLGCSSLTSKKLKNESEPATPADKAIAVNENDIRVLRRASEILSSSEHWNQKDNRECPEDARQFSLYCALYKSSLEINGEFDHRLGALEETRRTIEDESKGRSYEHRLMGYNNDSSTKFADIKNVLNRTEQRIRDRLRIILKHGR
jgi:hypothetical protein